MRIHVLSDLHLEFGEFAPAAVAHDVVVLAGDIWLRAQGLHWAARYFRPERCVYVLGNHEFYRSAYVDVVEECRETAHELGMRFLHDSAVVIDGVRFLGSILWSDFRLYGDGAAETRAMAMAGAMINDFQLIRNIDRESPSRAFSPAHARSYHRDSRAFLEDALKQPFAGKTVVVTHFLPAKQSIAPKYKGEPLNPYFCSDLHSMIEQHQPALWIHGHTHESCDYEIGRTRVLCNPRGYFPSELNGAFDPALTVVV